MRWLVDANVWIAARKAGLLTNMLRASERVSLLVPWEVSREIAGSHEVRATKWRDQLAASPAAALPAIPLNSAAAVVFAKLRAGRATAADAGECECVALALTDFDDATFVTADKGAAYLALAELRGVRVRALPEFLHHLIEEDALTIVQAEKIARQASDRLPHWWPSVEDGA